MEQNELRIGLLVTDTLCDCGQELRLVAFHQLQDSGFKLVEHVHACVVANSRTEVASGVREWAPPVRDISTARGSTVGGGRGQYTKKVRRVQPSSSRIIMRHHDARGRISHTAYQTFAFQGMIAVTLARCGSKNSLAPKVPCPVLVWLLSVKMAEVKTWCTTGTRWFNIRLFTHGSTRRGVENLLQRLRLCCSLRRLMLGRRRVRQCVRRGLHVSRLAKRS